MTGLTNQHGMFKITTVEDADNANNDAEMCNVLCTPNILSLQPTITTPLVKIQSHYNAEMRNFPKFWL